MGGCVNTKEDPENKDSIFTQPKKDIGSTMAKAEEKKDVVLRHQPVKVEASKVPVREPVREPFKEPVRGPVRGPAQEQGFNHYKEELSFSPNPYKSEVSQEGLEHNPYRAQSVVNQYKQNYSEVEQDSYETRQHQKEERQRLERLEKQRLQKLRLQKEREERQLKQLRRLQRPEEFSWQPLKVLLDCTLSSFNHMKIVCCICNTKNFSGIRLACLCCRDVSICGGCFEVSTHDVSHPLAIIQNELNEKGTLRLQEMSQLFKKQDSQHSELAWRAWCSSCKDIRQSVFLTGTKDGLTLCKPCFEREKPSQIFVVSLLPVSPKLELGEFQAEGSGFMSGSRVKKVIHRGSGREFGLSVVRARTEDRKSYLATRNQLLKFRGNNVLNVYAYREERLEGSTYQLSVLQEWMPNLNLSTLVRSPVFANFSLRRKTGIFKSLATALKSIHSLELYHGNLSPEFVLLDTYHEVRLELVPFVNHFAEVQGLEHAKNPYRASQAASPAQSDIESFALIMSLVLTGKEHQGKDRPEFAKTLPVFRELFESCLGPRKPSAKQLDSYFGRFEKQFWELVGRKYGRKEYEHKGTQEKDRIFQEVYQQFRQ